MLVEAVEDMDDFRSIVRKEKPTVRFHQTTFPGRIFATLDGQWRMKAKVEYAELGHGYAYRVHASHLVTSG